LADDASPGLSSELGRLRGIVADMLEGEVIDKDHADSLAKLVNAVTKLAEFERKAATSVSESELSSLVMAMGAVVNDSVPDRLVQTKIQRGWLDLISEATK